jgi:polyisoprenoid-binding protein YceI
MRITKVAFFALALAGATSAGAEPSPKPTPLAFESVRETARVEFLAIGRPSLLRIKGSGVGVSGSIAVRDSKASGELRFPLTSLATGISLRDRHMKETYLETEKHPEAILKIVDVPLAKGWSLQTSTLNETPFTGTLRLHGVEKPVSGTFSLVSGGSSTLTAEAKFEIQLSDFGVKIPTYAGITIANNVVVTASLKELKLVAAPEDHSVH